MLLERAHKNLILIPVTVSEGSEAVGVGNGGGFSLSKPTKLLNWCQNSSPFR